MPDESWRRDSSGGAPTRADRTRDDGQGRTPPRVPGRQAPGWRVTPPNGGGQTPGGRPPTNSRWLVILLVLGLLVVNFVISYEAQQPPARVQIPYSPTFLDQVSQSNVSEISSTGDSIQGTFRTAVKYPPNNKGAQPTTRFSTTIPSFANNAELSKLLQNKQVTINAHIAGGVSFLSELIFGFGPTILLVALFVFLMRRAAGAGAGGLMSFGRSRARRVEGADQKVTFEDVAGIDEAKEAAPAIIFIDELDAIGRSRASGAANISGGHDEREQTLNQILTEMDGFDPRTGVIVLGATNRPEILDPALLRPGRFDRRVSVQAPDRAGRDAILRVHTRSVPLAPEVDLAAIASSTPGMVGADLANLVNEAALLAARRDHDKVTTQDFTDALERVVLGAERKVMLSEDDRRRTAYHEGGHAIVGMLTPGADPVRKVSIIPRGQALGVTFSAPDNDRFNFDQHYLMAQIKVALGGRSAEEVVFDDITTGAESDIQHLTMIARHMVGRWGMSEAIGPVAVIPADSAGPLLPGVRETSEATQRIVDEEVKRIVEAAHGEVTEILREHRSNLDSLASALLEQETLDEANAYEAAGLPRNPLAHRETVPPAAAPSSV